MEDDKMNTITPFGDDGSNLMPSHDEVKDMLGTEKQRPTPAATSKEAVSKDERIPFSKSRDEKQGASQESTETPEAEEVEEPQYSNEELKAVERGWVPKEDFKGDPDRWVTSHQFLDRMQMMERIDGQKQELTSLRKSNEKLVSMFQNIAETDTEKKATDVLEQKRNAIMEGNVDEVERYEKEYRELKRKAETFKELEYTAEQEHPTEIREFMQRNKTWYNHETHENKEMRDYADRLDAQYRKEPYYAAMPLYRRLEEVEKAVKTAFSERFQNPNRRQTQSVEGKTYSRPKNNKIKFEHLSAEFKSVIENMTKTNPHISKDQYAQQLVDLGVIQNG